MIVTTTLHSYNLRFHFMHMPGFDALAFADLAVYHGFKGIALSLNDVNYRHLGGREPARMDALRRHLDKRSLSLEIDTSGTDPAHLSAMIMAAERMGARSLRTYTRHHGLPAARMAATVRDLAAVMPVANACQVTVVLENHEDFTGAELAAIVTAVDSPFLRVLYDYGNSQMVLEDPEAALDAVLPLVHSVHVKDHVLVNAGNKSPLVAGVPIGRGFLPIRRLTSRLLNQGLRTFCFENVWGYATTIKTTRQASPDIILGRGSFAFLAPPFDPSQLLIDPASVDPALLVEFEREALLTGILHFKGLLEALGCQTTVHSG